MIHALSDPTFKEVLVEHIDQGSRFSVSTSCVLAFYVDDVSTSCVLAFYVDDVHDATASTA
jgi:hypothetical protein